MRGRGLVGGERSRERGRAREGRLGSLHPPDGAKFIGGVGRECQVGKKRRLAPACGTLAIEPRVAPTTPPPPPVPREETAGR